MSTDLKEMRQASSEAHVMPTRRDPRWPFVATGIVLAAIVAVALLVVVQAGPRSSQGQSGGEVSEDLMIQEGFSRGLDRPKGPRWNLPVRSHTTSTAVREGSGYAPTDDPLSGSDLRARIYRHMSRLHTRA